MIEPDYRGKGYMDLLLDAIRSDMKKQDELELRLYEHEDNQVAMGPQKIEFHFFEIQDHDPKIAGAVDPIVLTA